MNNKTNLALKIFGVIILLLVLMGFFTYRYIDKTFLSFEDGFHQRIDFKELTVEGYTFLDRNGNGALDIYEDERQTLQVRVSDVLSKMTKEEKIHLLKGSGISSLLGSGEPGGIPGAVGTIVPTPRLGIPSVNLSDGPAGLRIQPVREGIDRTYYCTAFPIATLLASSWNEDLLKEVGDAMGKEAEAYGIDVILGPGANIQRHPLCGRNFEYYSEDPLLSGYMGAAVVNGIQGNGIGTSVKHFVANNQETERNLNDVLISERAYREIYLKGFEYIVSRSQPWTIMSSYNKVNGVFTSENKKLLSDILRDDWHFQGLVMTDWFGGRDPVAQIIAGNDLLAPGTNRQWEALLEAAKNGDLPEKDIDRAAQRILTLIFKTKKMQDYEFDNNPDLKKHAQITRNSAAEGMVLLKNEEVLPLTDVKNIALLGVTSYEFIAGGSGSGDVNEAYTVSLEEGLQKAGFEINSLAKQAFDNHKNLNLEGFTRPEGLNAIFNPYMPPELRYTKEQLYEIASSSDVGIFTLGRNAGEGGDRVEADDFLLTNTEKELINNIVEIFHDQDKKVVIVLNIGGVIETASWKSLPDAILLAWQGGQEGGNSVADILLGKVNPSAKLPMTFPNKLADHASHANFPKNPTMIRIETLLKNMIFPVRDRPESEKVRDEDYTYYDEGIYVGYRHFDKINMEVSYPFGYGLSYTNFEYKNMSVAIENDSVQLKFSIKNVGEVPGKEIVQVYTEKLYSNIDRPKQELKSFAKTRLLKPGEEENIFLQIPIRELRYWDEHTNSWSLELGAYNINTGASSRDIKQVVQIIL